MYKADLEDAKCFHGHLCRDTAQISLSDLGIPCFLYLIFSLHSTCLLS